MCATKQQIVREKTLIYIERERDSESEMFHLLQQFCDVDLNISKGRPLIASLMLYCHVAGPITATLYAFCGDGLWADHQWPYYSDLRVRQIM